MKSKLVVFDVEADGPCPNPYSMVCFGAVVVEPELKNTFYGRTAPISAEYDPEALKVSGFTRLEHWAFPLPEDTMMELYKWLTSFDFRPVFISDNPAFDWQFINWYLHNFVLRKLKLDNPLGFSAKRIGDIYAGYQRSLSGKWNNHWKKTYRKTKHDHNPLNDALGNAEALLSFANELGIEGILQ